MSYSCFFNKNQINGKSTLCVHFTKVKNTYTALNLLVKDVVDDPVIRDDLTAQVPAVTLCHTCTRASHMDM